MGAVHIGICHYDDAVVAEFGDVECAFLVTVADAGADGGDHGLDFGILEDFIEAGFFDVDEFAADGEDGLVASVAALFGGAAGGVTFYDEEFCEGGVAFGAIGEFTWKAAAGERAFADGFSCFAGSLAGAGGHEGFFDYFFCDWGVGIEVSHEAIVGDGADDSFDFWDDEFGFGL